MSWWRRLGTRRAGQHTEMHQMTITKRCHLLPPPLLLRCIIKIVCIKSSLTSFCSNLQVILKIAMDLPMFWSRMQPHLDYAVPKGHVGRGCTKTPCLSPQAKRVVFRITSHLLQKLEKVCFVRLEAENILVDPKTEEVYISDSTQEAPVKTQAGVNSNINQLGHILEELIKTKKLPAHLTFPDFKMPAEIQHLLDLMQSTNPLRMSLVIKYHSSMVPMGLRGSLYLLVHQWLMDHVRVADYRAFDDVLAGIDPTEGDWVCKLKEGNRYLFAFYSRGLRKGSYDARKDESAPILHPLDFNRNVHSHTFEGCASRATGPRFSKKDMNLALYFIFGTQLASLMVALHARGYLCHLEKDIADFFPY